LVLKKKAEEKKKFLSILLMVMKNHLSYLLDWNGLG
jgi:hypothetical protein